MPFFLKAKTCLFSNWPFLSSVYASALKSEAKYEAIDMEMVFPHANKTHFSKNVLALSLVLKVRVFLELGNGVIQK